MQPAENPVAGEIARAFVQARRAGAELPDYLGEMPASLADAYRV